MNNDCYSRNSSSSVGGWLGWWSDILSCSVRLGGFPWSSGLFRVEWFDILSCLVRLGGFPWSSGLFWVGQFDWFLVRLRVILSGAMVFSRCWKWGRWAAWGDQHSIHQDIDMYMSFTCHSLPARRPQILGGERYPGTSPLPGQIQVPSTAPGTAARVQDGCEGYPPSGTRYPPRVPNDYLWYVPFCFC
jgi:hypothetical protein